jgi:branched-chain amino acid aminotransferase
VDPVLARAANPESYIRLILTRGVGDISYHFERIQGPTLVIAVKPYDAPPESHYREGIAVAVASVRRNSPRALDPAIKSCNLLNNILAIREAHAGHASEALLLNERDELAEGASSNVFMARGGRVFTPPLDAGILPGITREVVLELAPTIGVEAQEKTLSVADLLEADEAFITSSTREIVGIRTVDGRALGRAPGPLTARLLAAFREYAPRHCE